ncbi:MAG: SecDF P1 head subdomain-containing protein [Gaiellaceae bacterium]
MADRSRVGVLAVIAAGLLVGCGASQHPASLRISGEGGIGPVLSRADLRSARADVDPGTSQPVILLELTPNGQRKFLGLTTRVARAGRRRHRPAHIFISVNGKVIGAPYIDYHVSPNGLPADNGMQIDVASVRAAHDLAASLNR